MEGFKREKLKRAFDIIDEMPNRTNELNNFERLFSLRQEEFAQALCDAQQSCSTCPHEKGCCPEQSGWLAWLDSNEKKFGGKYGIF